MPDMIFPLLFAALIGAMSYRLPAPFLSRKACIDFACFFLALRAVVDLVAPLAYGAQTDPRINYLLYGLVGMVIIVGRLKVLASARDRGEADTTP